MRMKKFKLDDKSRKRSEQEIDDMLGDLVDFGFQKSQQLVSVDEGTLQGSGFVLHFHLRHFYGYNAPHAPWNEFGTQPHWPPHKPLWEWVMRNKHFFGIKGSGKKVESQAHGIARALQVKQSIEGTMPRPFMRPSFEFMIVKAESFQVS